MRIVDVNGFYAPKGGGVRTYVEWKLRAAARAGHHMHVIAPGPKDLIEHRAGGMIHWVAAPYFPLDRRYRMLVDAAPVHRVLDELQPDVVEASSPWRTASIVTSWAGDAQRHWIMHADPLAAYAYRWFGRIARQETIDAWFRYWWRYLRRAAAGFDSVICASQSLADRLSGGGLTNVRLCRFGAEPGIFSPTRRDLQLRDQLCQTCQIGANDLLLLAVGRHSSEKKWHLVMEAVGGAAAIRPVGMILVGEGRESSSLHRAIGGNPHIRMIKPIENRDELARLMASVDGLVHGCDAETFCFVAAEAAASGIPVVVPEAGAAADAAAQGVVHRYVADDRMSAIGAIGTLRDAREAMLALAAQKAALGMRTMDDHFAELFRHYAGHRQGRRSLVPLVHTTEKPLREAVPHRAIPHLASRSAMGSARPQLREVPSQRNVKR